MPGRLANKLINLCHWQALVKPYGYFLVPCHFSFEKFFLGTRKHWLSRYLLLPTVAKWFDTIEIGANQPEAAQERILAILESGRSATIGLHDWLPLSLRNRRFDETRARRYFTPVRRFRRAAQTAVEGARETGIPLVGVHIRHGDFDVHDDGRWFLRLETVVANMSRFREMAGETRFLICSDAHFSARDFPGLNVTFGPNHFVSDLTALAWCDYILKPGYSTYALWSAWWGQTPCLVMRNRPSFGLPDFKVPTLEPVVQNGVV